MSKVFALLAIFAIAASAVAQSEPQLLTSKSVANERVVDGKDLTLIYNIYNIGEAAAENVVLTDSFPRQFTVKHGLTTVSWDRLAAGANLTHVIILAPNFYGFVNLTAATVTYKSGDDTITSTSSVPQEFFVEDAGTHARYFGTHYQAWAIFTVLAAILIGTPYMIFNKSQKKYSKTK